MTKIILVRFGDLMLKGKNIRTFINQMIRNITFKLRNCETTYDKQHDRLYIYYPLDKEKEIIEKLNQVPGIASFSIVYKTSLAYEDLIDTSITIIDETLKNQDGTTFKIETKRANKRFPMTSQETSRYLAPLILSRINVMLKIDVKKPQEILNIEIRDEAAYIYMKKIKGMGGFPSSTGDGALLMLSGGIDSPVAGYLTLKQGVKLELIHFESTPLTPLESTQKVIDLAKNLSMYTPKESISLHIVPFKKIHESILNKVPDPYHITIMRRMMYRISEKYALKHQLHALVNGESIGQVASQTLQSLRAVEDITRLPIIRPLITSNKDDIISLARQIGTYEISIRPFNDCCSIYVPKQPATKPRDYIAERYERLAPFEEMINETIEGIISIEVDPNMTLDLSMHGFSVSEAIENYNKGM